MKKSFTAFTMVMSLFMALIMLRLCSISFPRDISMDTAIIYLDEYHDSGSLFKIFHQESGFKLRPYINSLWLNGRPVRELTGIQNRDILRVKDHDYLLTISPETHHYREIYRRPVNEIFPSVKTVKYIGGWISRKERQALTHPEDLDLLSDLIIEISPDRLSQVVPASSDIPCKLLVLKRVNQSLQLTSPVREMIRIRNYQRKRIPVNLPVNIQTEDIVRFSNLKDTEDLEIKFNFKRIKSRVFRGSRGHEQLVSSDITYLIVSYREKIKKFEPAPRIVTLRAFNDQSIYRVSENREALFIGEKGLFLFDLNPAALLEGRFIPDRIYEGGMMDYKELLDRGMIFRKDKNVFPVNLRFLEQLSGPFRKGVEGIRDYLRQQNIDWKHFGDDREFMAQFRKSKQMIEKMKRKRVWAEFCRQIEKLNDPYFLKGVGIQPAVNTEYSVFYRVGDFSWNPSEKWNNDIPEVVGIQEFYWGNLIKNQNRVEFKIQFLQNPSTLRFISVGEYAFSLDGKTYANRNFFDGIQTVIPRGERPVLYIRISDLNRFNRDISEASLRFRIDLSDHRRQTQSICSDDTWESSIDAVNWSPVKTFRRTRNSLEEEEVIPAIWYDEIWKPVFRGIKNRYFKKSFNLEFDPEDVSWKVKTTGEFLIRLNDRTVYSENDFLQALHSGKNTLILLVSINGYLKKIPESDVFMKKGNRVYIRERQIGKSVFSPAESSRRADVVDVNRKKLVFDSSINGRYHRFYSDTARNELRAIIGGDGTFIWGLEPVFSDVYRRHPVTEIQMTINQDWQKIVSRNLNSLLQKLKKQEISNPAYQKLNRELIQSESELSHFRVALTRVEVKNSQRIMERIIQIQRHIERLKTEINRIKNHFYEASMILMNPCGQIQAAACYPFDQEGMEELNGEIQKPYRAYEVPDLNRTWKWNYNPGSTAKILDSISFLHSRKLRDPATGFYEFPLLRQLLDPSSDFYSFPRNDLKGSRMLNGKQVFFQLQNFRGHNVPPGFCSLIQALSHSYNTYFAYLALHNNRMLTRDSRWFRGDSYFISKSNIPIKQSHQEYPILKFAERLLINQPIDLLSNLYGTEIAANLNRMPYDAFMAIPSRFPVNAYTASDIAYYAIGQSDFRLTALQNALVASSIMNNGMLYHPSLVKSITLETQPGGSKKYIAPDPEQYKARVFDQEIADTIKEAMKNVVDAGTAGGLFSRDLKQGRCFYAKTGTAETKFYQDHSLFMGFVTFRDRSSLIFSTIVPRSGTGAAVAGRLTADVIKEIIQCEQQKPL